MAVGFIIILSLNPISSTGRGSTSVFPQVTREANAASKTCSYSTVKKSSKWSWRSEKTHRWITCATGTGITSAVKESDISFRRSTWALSLCTSPDLILWETNNDSEYWWQGSLQNRSLSRLKVLFSVSNNEKSFLLVSLEGGKKTFLRKVLKMYWG